MCGGEFVTRGRAFVLVLVCSWSAAASQSPAASPRLVPLAERLRTRIKLSEAPELLIGDEVICASAMLPGFYEDRKYRPAWSDRGRLTRQAGELLKTIRNAELEGLMPGDYHLGRIESTMMQIHESRQKKMAPSPETFVDLDLLLTDAFLVLGSHMLAGRVNPEAIDSEWHSTRREADLVELLQRAIRTNRVGESLAGLLPTHPGYARMRKALKFYRSIAESGGWPVLPDDTELVVGDRSERVVTLRRRLTRTLDLEPGDAEDDSLFDGELDQALRRFQRRHGLRANGLVDAATLRTLNVSAEERVRQIELNMERWRWLPQDLGRQYIILNIASYELDVVEDTRRVITFRAVVGKPYRSTPIFSSRITSIVFNPSWSIPQKIAAEDILPLIKRDPDYLIRNKIRVFGGAGPGGEVDPATVDWSRVTASSFGYFLRQDPGLRNALGKMLFRLPNKYGVYIHDTPSQGLFRRAERTFSAGCIRLEYPVELAVYLLREDEGWKKKEILKAIRTGREQTVRLPAPMPVHILYWTAWVDEDGIVQFRKDIYDRDETLYRALKEPLPGVVGCE
jgi:murein L,D-transpeptidase YcbB/YkuD